jgi:hypothetical protein
VSSVLRTTFGGRPVAEPNPWPDEEEDPEEEETEADEEEAEQDARDDRALNEERENE